MVTFHPSLLGDYPSPPISSLTHHTVAMISEQPFQAAKEYSAAMDKYCMKLWICQGQNFFHWLYSDCF